MRKASLAVLTLTSCLCVYGGSACVPQIPQGSEYGNQNDNNNANQNGNDNTSNNGNQNQNGNDNMNDNGADDDNGGDPPAGQLALLVSATPDPVAPGELATFSFTISNQGPVDLVDVTLSSLTPDNLFVVDITDDGSCGFSCSSGEEMTWLLDLLHSGETRTVQFTGEILGFISDGTQIRVTSSVIAANAAQARAEATVVVREQPVLALAMFADESPTQSGASLVYSLTFSNRGSVTAGSVNLRAGVPNGTTFASASDSGILDAGGVNWSLGNISPGTSGRREYVVSVSSQNSSGNVLAASAEITSSISPEYRAVANSIIAVSNNPPLNLSLDPIPDPAAPGEIVAFSFTVRNQGPVDLAGVTLSTLTPDYLFVVDITDDGSCGFSCSSGEQMTWLLDLLRSGETRTVQFTGEILGFIANGTLIQTTGSAMAPNAPQALAGVTVVVQDR